MKRSVIVAWSLALLCVVGSTAKIIILVLSSRASGIPLDFVDLLGWNWALPVFFALPAALIIARQPHNRVGWLLMVPALSTLIDPGALLARPQTVMNPGIWLLLWLTNWVWIPMIFAIFLIPLHFPTGRPPSPRWNWVNWLALSIGSFVLLILTFVEAIGPPNYTWSLPNPIGFIPVEIAESPLVLFVGGIGLVMVASASVISLLVRYRRSQYIERLQIKWLLFVGAIFVVFYTITYFGSDPEQFGALNIWTNILFLLSILAFPVAIAISILRYRLFDIDVIIRKTLIYAALSGSLALVYFGLVVLLQAIFESISGERSPVIIIISTLIIAALFVPLRQRIQLVIDRRFYRKKYDAQQIVARFAETARDEVSLEVLAEELNKVIQETIQPDSISIWLKRRRQQ